MSKSYTYAVARIRALEARMLNSAHENRMFEAADIEKAFFVLNETKYADHISAAKHPFEYEEILRAEMVSTYEMLNNYAGKDEALQLVYRKYDFGNAKILIRALKLKIENVDKMLGEFGLVDKEKMISYIMKGEGSLPVWLEKAVPGALLAFEEEKTPAAIDRVLDDAYIKSLAASESKLLQTLAKLWKETPHPFDAAGDAKTISLLKNVKRKAFGIDPLITYWLIKELETKMIRMTLAAKKHYISTRLIKDVSRESYV